MGNKGSAYVLLYDELKKVSSDEWLKTDPTALAHQISDKLSKELGMPLFKKDGAAGFGVTFILVGRIANSCSKDEFCEFMETGEAPPLKLTKKEMTCLNGGINWKLVGGLALGAVAVGAAFKLGSKSGFKQGADEFQGTNYRQGRYDAGEGYQRALDEAGVDPAVAERGRQYSIDNFNRRGYKFRL